MNADVKESKPKALKVHIYGVSASSVKNGVEQIAGVNPGNDTVKSRETGRVGVMPEIFTQLSGCDAGGGDCDIICVVIMLVMLLAVAVVWVIVMIVFSLFTLGGFIKRRYRTLVFIEKENSEFLGKLSIIAVKRGGVANYELNDSQYDEWAKHTFDLFIILKYLRQISLLLGFIWGSVELGFKLYQILFNPLFSYNLWPLRIVMVVIFVPLIFYSPYLEYKFRKAFDTGDEVIARIVSNYPLFNPDTPMLFEEKPKLSTGKIQL